MMGTLFNKTISCLRPLASNDGLRVAVSLALIVVMTFLVCLVAPAVTTIAHWIVEAMFEGRFA